MDQVTIYAIHVQMKDGKEMNNVSYTFNFSSNRLLPSSSLMKSFTINVPK